MNGAKRFLYQSVVVLVKAYQKLFLDLQVWGRANIPPGPKIYVSNHITSLDPLLLLPVFTEPVHIIVGPGYQSKIAGWIYDFFEHINAMPEHRGRVVDQAVQYLDRGESVYIAPEGDLQKPFHLGRFYPGVARIHRRTGVPIVPMAIHTRLSALREYPRFKIKVDGREYRTVLIWRDLLCINIGTPYSCEPVETDDEGEADQRILDELKERMRDLVEDVRVHKFWLE